MLVILLFDDHIIIWWDKPIVLCGYSPTSTDWPVVPVLLSLEPCSPPPPPHMQVNTVKNEGLKKRVTTFLPKNSISPSSHLTLKKVNRLLFFSIHHFPNSKNNTPSAPPPSLISCWSAADVPWLDPQVPGWLDTGAKACISVRLNVQSAFSESAKTPAGPNPYLAGPEETPRPLKAPQRPSIDFFLLRQKQRDFLSYMIYHNHIICSSESTGVWEAGQHQRERDLDKEVQTVLR